MMSTLQEARRVLLRETAFVAGREWFASWREDLVREGRSMDGGWPGTLSEARARVTASVGRALARRKMDTATYEELGLAVRAAYDEAKRAWRQSHGLEPKFEPQHD